MKIGKFQVVGELGAGANSKILHVRRSADSKNYALKVVPITSDADLKFLDQARHEFEVAQHLDHPNLIKVYALETPRDWLFRVRKVHLLIEYINGKTLDTYPRFPVPHLVQLFERIASALVHMHRRGYCHSDLKPNNILMSRAGDVKIIDYGLARKKGEGRGRVQGTPEYMAPEQARQGFVNERTDIYNFGATMYRLVCWRLPPSMAPAPGGGISLDETAWKKALKPVEECNREAPPGLCELVHRCIEFNSHKRPEHMSEIQGALDHLAEELVRSPEDKLGATEE